MDWNNLIADVEMILPSRCYTPGRAGSVRGVTIHHMASDLSIVGCYNLWLTSGTSAHYAAQADGLIGQLVNDWDTAWACGNDWANSNTISIEHANNGAWPWTVHPAALESGAHLVAAICHKYGLGEPEWMVNVFPHNYWTSTTCPGELAGSQNAEFMARAQYWYREMNGEEDMTPEQEAKLNAIYDALTTTDPGSSQEELGIRTDTGATPLMRLPWIDGRVEMILDLLSDTSDGGAGAEYGVRTDTGAKPLERIPWNEARIMAMEGRLDALASDIAAIKAAVAPDCGAGDPGAAEGTD